MTLNNRIHKCVKGQNPRCCNKYGLRMLDYDEGVEVRMTLENRHAFLESNPINKATDDNYLRFDFIFLDQALAKKFYQALKDNELKFVERYTGPIQEDNVIRPQTMADGTEMKGRCEHYYEQKPRWPSHTMTGGRP